MSAAITIAMPRMVPNQLLAEAHAKYPESLARAGAEMRWIELNDPDKAVQDALACDGLLLPGGGDIDPKFYGQERIPACGEPNVLRDIAEPLLLRAFLAADKPVLAICRGIQLMNVALGGDLYQDIKPFEHVPQRPLGQDPHRHRAAGYPALPHSGAGYRTGQQPAPSGGRQGRSGPCAVGPERGRHRGGH